MQTKLITFIICVNNEMYYEECTYYINRLVLPKGYDIDMIAIREADSIVPPTMRECRAVMPNIRFTCTRM